MALCDIYLIIFFITYSAHFRHSVNKSTFSNILIASETNRVYSTRGSLSKTVLKIVDALCSGT